MFVIMGNYIYKTLLFLFMTMWNYKGGALAVQDCGSVVNDTLKSPGYPAYRYYGRMADCNYSVAIPHGMALKITFQASFVLTYICRYRYVYLKISNDYKEIFGVYCGQFSGKEIIVSGNYVVLTYHSSFSYKMAFFLTFASVQAELPKLTLLELSSVVRSFSGYQRIWAVTGTPLIHTALTHNSRVLFNTTNSTGRFKLDHDGNYSFVATNRFGTDMKEFSAIITDCGPNCSYQWSKRFQTNILWCRNVTSLADVITCALTYTTTMWLRSNNIQNLPEDVFSSLTHLWFLDLSSNNIKYLSENVFSSLTGLYILDFSGNKIQNISKSIFSGARSLMTLDLSSNNIQNLGEDVFSTLIHLIYLYLLDNKIPSISTKSFANNQLLHIFLAFNRLENIPSRAFTNLAEFNWEAEHIIMLSDNPIRTIEPEAFKLGRRYNLRIYLVRTKLKILTLESFIGLKDLDAKLLLQERIPRTLKYYSGGQNRFTMYINPHNSKADVIKVGLTGAVAIPALALISALLSSGFKEISANPTASYYLPCPEGTFSNFSSKGTEGCTPCPPGGFYSDDVGYVGTSCKKCPNGSFVAFDKAPGTRTQDCKSCPKGTETDFFAGYRACQCLKGMYRTHMFKECVKCGHGLICKADYATLKSGYWWKWRNESQKRRYMDFINNLLAPLPALDVDDVQYPYPIPKQYKCPMEKSCKGGLDSSCTSGYEGPLCDICSSNHYKQFQTCKRCPSKKWIAGQLSIVMAILLIIMVISVWMTNRSKKNNTKKEECSSIDVFLAKLKIVIGFYQVTNGLLEVFSYIRWPDSLQVISKYSQILQLNVLQMAPVQCLSTGIRVDAFGNLFAIMSINAAAIVFAGVAYGVRKSLVLKNNHLEDEEKSKRVSQTKELTYRGLFFFLYVTYLSTWSKTATVLPLACRKLCADEGDDLCPAYLKTDYSVRCHKSRYSYLVIVAYISAAYIIALPAATFVALWRQRRATLVTEDTSTSQTQDSGSEVTTGLRFLFESYKLCTWYWELVEMSRKVIVTSLLILVGQQTRSYIGLTLVIAGMYGTVFCWIHPLQDAFENRLMSTSLAVTVVNLVIGAVSRIPAENLPAPTDSYMDSVTFNILVIGANTLVIGIVVVQYAVHLYGYFKEWRKNPHWSLSCCLALLLPLINFAGEISGLAGTNATGAQLDTGQMEMPTFGDAVKDSGAIDVALGMKEQDDDSPKTVQEEDCKDTQLQNGEKETSIILGAVKDSGDFDGTFEHGEAGEGIGHAINKKCHQAAQTELSANFSIKKCQSPRANTGHMLLSHCD